MRWPRAPRGSAGRRSGLASAAPPPRSSPGSTEERTPMSSAGLPTIWERVAEGAATLPEPFTRAALINWVSARRPDVGVASIAAHIQFATENAAHPDHGPFADRTPLLYRVERGRYRRFRAPDRAWWP